MSTNTTFVNQWIKRLSFAVILLVIVLSMSYAFVNLQSVVRFGSSGTSYESNVQRGINADAARYTALAKYYIDQAESVRLGIQTDAARYTAMTEFYSVWRDELRLIHEADTARYTAMAKYYTTK